MRWRNEYGHWRKKMSKPTVTVVAVVFSVLGTLVVMMKYGAELYAHLNSIHLQRVEANMR